MSSRGTSRAAFRQAVSALLSASRNVPHPWPRSADRVGETACVFLAGLHRVERTIAERLMRPANGKLPWPWIDPDKALPWVEGRIGLALAESPPSTTSGADPSERSALR